MEIIVEGFRDMMAAIFVVVGWLIKPYLFKKFNVSIKDDGDGWYTIYSGDTPVSCTGSYKAAEESAMISCMSQFDIVVRILTGMWPEDYDSYSKER